jgi:hypothetical protein
MLAPRLKLNMLYLAWWRNRRMQTASAGTAGRPASGVGTLIDFSLTGEVVSYFVNSQNLVAFWTWLASPDRSGVDSVFFRWRSATCGLLSVIWQINNWRISSGRH